jgi:hypothetical protein
VRKTYIGISGYASAEQARQVHQAVRPLLGSRVLADGYLVWLPFLNPKWAGSEEVHPTFNSRFLSLDAAVSAFAAPGHGSLRIVHFGTSTHTRLDEQLENCSELLGGGIDGFQINAIPRPNPRELADFRGHRDLLVILQLHRSVLNRAQGPDDLVRYVEPYVERDAVTHVLYDPSEGLGSAFDPERAIRGVARLRAEFPGLSCGVAGGLAPENVRDMVAPLWAADRSINIDVEGRVRDPATDTLDVPRAVAYARAALTLARDMDNGIVQS